MDKIIKDLVEYNGIQPFVSDQCMTEVPSTFKQGNLDFAFCVPVAKPDIEQVVKIWVDFEIAHYEVVDTPIGTSYEGQTITGKKLLLVGDLNYKVEYVGNNCDRSVHTAHTKVPFCQYIVMPEGFNIYTTVSPMVYIEDIFTSQTNCRCIYNNVTLMTVVYTC